MIKLFNKNKLILIFAVFFVTSFFDADSASAKGFISDSMEVSIGQQYHYQIVEKNGGEWYNPQVLSHVEAVGRRIVAVCGRTSIPYRFTLVNSNEFNASSLPGGFVYISRGAIGRLENDAQLACLLGHEVAHISRRHCASLLEQQMGMDLILGVIGMIAGRQSEDTRERIQAISGVGSVVIQVAQRGYGREKELEADRYGAEYAALAGYDPGGMLQILYMLQEKEGRGEPGFTEIFQTHPAPSKRIAKIKEYLEEAYASSSAASYRGNFYPKEYVAEVARSPQNDLAYDYYLAGIRYAKSSMYGMAVDKFHQALKCDPTFADAHDALGTVLLRQRRYDDAIFHFDRAVRYGQKAIYYNNLGSAYYYKTDFAKAIRCFEAAIRIYPYYSQAYANMAENYRCLRNYTRATGYAEKAVRLSPDNFFAHSVLAIIYEERGWRNDAIREYEVLLESAEYRQLARERLAVLRRM